MRSPVAFPFRGRWLAVGQTDEGNDPGGWSVSRRRGAQCAPAGRSQTGPYENNAVAPISAVGAGPRPARKPSPCKGEGGTRSVTDEGDFLACPPAGGPVCRPYGNEGMSQNIASPDAQLELRPGASLVSFWAPRKKLAARDMSRKNKNFPGGEIWPRPCLKIGNVPDGEGFFRQTRRFDAAILCVLQGKSTQYGGKRTAVWAY